MYDQGHEAVELGSWLDLAEEVVRRHRQGRVLAVDPALVLRGLPPLWRSATADAGPADDVVALAGVAVSRLEPGDPARDLLLEAAAGCRGSDLPALLRQVRPLLHAHTPEGAHDPSAGSSGRPHGDGPDHAPCVGATHGGHSPDRATGRRLAVAGAVAAGAMVAVGGASTLTGGRAGTQTDLGAGPLTVADDRAVLRWDPPHLEVDVEGVRYRYRLAGDVEVDDVAWRDDPRHPTLVVRAGGSRWEVPVPVLDRLSGTARPR